jgi:N-acetylneuraminic acid mutarotase
VTGDNEGYDVSTNVWSSLADDPTPRSHTCNGVVNGDLYSAGGANTADNALAVNEAFNLSKNSWTTKASIPQAVAAAGSAIYDGLLYCFGGSSKNSIPPGTVYNDVQIYQP